MCAVKSRGDNASTGHAVHMMTLKKARTHVTCAKSLESLQFAAGALLPATGKQVWGNLHSIHSPVQLLQRAPKELLHH